jgi:hypothetical protein
MSSESFQHSGSPLSGPDLFQSDLFIGYAIEGLMVNLEKTFSSFSFLFLAGHKGRLWDVVWNSNQKGKTT